MTKKIKIEITQEAIDYVQRIGYEVDGYTHIINSLFEQHKNDIDDSVIKSVPFQTYQKKFFKVKAEYELAKQALEKELKKKVIEKTGIEDPKFSWNIPDFQELIVDIEVEED